MDCQLGILVISWMQKLNIPVASSFIREKLLSHPDYPSLLSITDTLDELNIENGAFVVEKEKIKEMPVPFLAHTGKRGGEFELITDCTKYIDKNPDFEKQWDGIAVVAEKPERFDNTENKHMLLQEKRKRQVLWFFIFFISGLSLFSVANNFSWQYAGLLLTTIAGLSVAVLIVEHELGISNEFTEQLCAAGKHTDCDVVMASKGSKLPQWLNPIAVGWADAGIIYFSSVFLLLIVSGFTGIVQSEAVVLSLLAAGSLPFTVFSVYYQWRVVKKWCPLCLATVAVLWIQFGLLLPGFYRFPFQAISPNETLFTLFTLCTLSAAWLLLIKPALQKNKGLADKNFSLLRFKNNPEVFNSLLKQQRKVDTTPFENDLQLGNPDADLQIIVACNPYCGPCAKTHEILHEFAEKNDIGVTVRFAIKTGNKEDRKLQAVRYLLQLTDKRPAVYKRKVLHDWYADMDFEKFSKKYFLENLLDVDSLLKQEENWSNESGIKFTPTIFINGHELPKQYRADDLKTMFRYVERPEGVSLRKYIDENELIPF
ncbi:MAG: thioredoxin domain-containing protein [Chitinophagaceae bacterium]|nr:thioredoxin domain-containing protein [Chitinophagaceae bacterium]